MSHASITPREDRRRRIAAVASVAAVLGVVFPVSMASYYAWRSAREAQVLRLESITAKVAERARIAMVQAHSALEGLEASDDPPCSPEHIALMRRFTLNTLSLEEIAYADDTQVRCTTWAQTGLPAPNGRPDFVLEGGAQAFQDMRSNIPGSALMLGLRKAHYLVLINADRFTDIAVPPDVHLVFLRQGGRVLSHTRDVPAEMLAQAATRQPAEEFGRYLVRTVEFDGWTAMAFGPAASDSDIGLRLQLLLPLGLLSAVIAIALVLRLSRKRLSPLAELRLAVRNKEFLLYYQPIIALATGRLVGAEALIRWQRPEGDMVRPDLFIPLAEDHGVICEITDLVMDRVVADLAALLRAHPLLHISVNLSAQDIARPDLLQRLQARLDAAGISAGQVWLEVTERGCVAIGAGGGTVLGDARAAGLQIAIDDFGTGYCGLQYLQKLPLDLIKIDRSFVQTVATDSVTSAVLPHIIALSQSLRLRMVAEGVETQVQADFLREQGVQYAQGWLFSEALPLQAFKDYVARQADGPTTLWPTGSSDAAAPR